MTLQHSIEKISVPGTWKTVDFHVHSPCSHDYFKSCKDEDNEYFRILENAEATNTNVIVITDHNDIQGYKKFLELVKNLGVTEKTLKQANTAIPDAIKQKYTLFDKVIILPGVELDVKPNIHLLVLFDPRKEIEMIEEFLDNAGFPNEKRGEETVSKYAAWDFHDALAEIEKIEAIGLAAHCDSDKGIYEASKKWGQERIKAFTNDSLYGMEFINPISKDQIKSILKQPDYERDYPIAFIQSSDFHGKDDQQVGERRTYVRMDEVDHGNNAIEVFRAIKKALRNPDEYISSPGPPELTVILNNLQDKPAVEKIDTQQQRETLLKYICAYANSEEGTVVIGRNDKGNWIGTKGENDEFPKQITGLLREKIFPSPSVSVQSYPYYEDKLITSIRVRKRPTVHCLTESDEVYLIDGDKTKKASTQDIVDLAENNLIDRYSHLSITENLQQIVKKITGIEDSLDILPIVKKIERVSSPLHTILAPPQKGDVIPDNLEEYVEIQGNGSVSGNIIFAVPTSPRYEDSYLRLSAPKGFFTPPEHAPTFEKFGGEKLIVVPSGGVFYDNLDDIVISCRQHKPLILSLMPNSQNMNLKYVLAYLKSTIALWYTIRCLGSPDIRDERILRKIPIPKTLSNEIIMELNSITDQLLDIENRFLVIEQEDIKPIKTNDLGPQSDEFQQIMKKRSEKVASHNQKAAAFINSIDRVFMQLIGISDEEYELIYRSVKASGFFASRMHD
jgi:histidinol phosphatase-like PHP family hydrolase